jgi:hypothetical protein
MPSQDLYQEAEGFTFNLGTDNGLRHSYVDEDVINGRRYFYALVAYDHGDSEKDIFPSENTKFISVQPNGEIITDINTAVIRPSAPVAGYNSMNSDLQIEHIDGPGTGSINYEVVDEEVLNGHTYRVFFTDTATDGIDNDNDWNVFTDDVGSDGVAGTNDPDSTENNGIPDVGEPNFEWRDPEEFAPITSSYSVLDITGHTETVELDTDFVYLEKRNILTSSMLISLVSEPVNYFNLDNFEIDSLRGKIRIKVGSSLSKDEYRLKYQYYPIYKSFNIQKSPYAKETLDSDIFDGIQLLFDNNWSIYAIESDTVSYWNTGNRRYNWDFSTGKVELGTQTIIGKRFPADFEIQFGDSVMYIIPEAFQSAPFWFPPVKTNFKIFNATDSVDVPFLLVRPSIFINFYPDSVYGLCPGDFLETFWKRQDSTYQYIWTITMSNLQSDPKDTVYQFYGGDILHIETTKPFRSDDVLEFITGKPLAIDIVAKQELDNIQVVPNPYVVANNMEAPLPPAITSGRGERRIEFRKLPVDAKVHIFTSNGTHVITLNHSEGIHNGTLAWNLKTKENLDIAFGVYFYIVESNVGKKSGKLAVIK